MIERVGIIGGGQLGRMLTEAAHPLGYSVDVIDPAYNCPAAQVGAEQITAGLDDKDAITQLGRRADVITWEIEHIPADYLRALEIEGWNIQPSPHTLAHIQDKLRQKQLLKRLGVPVGPFIDSLENSANKTGSYMVKSRRGGYDGRGNLRVESLNDPRITEQFGDKPVYAEQLLEFDKEIAVIGARDIHGNTVTYPVVETIHKDSICHIVLSPAEIDKNISDQAQEISRVLLNSFSGAGVFAIEMFVVGEDVYVNEIAPRVHNSGHHTIEANVTSQFEQHVRAVTGNPLGSVATRSAAAVMINILGTRDETLDRSGLENVLLLPDTHPHFYGKQPRPARKIGHITVLRSSIDEAKKVAEQARKELVI